MPVLAVYKPERFKSYFSSKKLEMQRERERKMKFFLMLGHKMRLILAPFI